MTGRLKLKWVQYALGCSAPGVPGEATGSEASTAWGNPRVFHAVGPLVQKLKLKRQKGSWDSMCRGHLDRIVKDEVGKDAESWSSSHGGHSGRTAKARVSAGQGMQVRVSWAALGC